MEHPDSGGVPTIDTRQLSTTVLVQNDQTIVLGGIIELSLHNNHSYLPWLRNVPGLSWFLSREDQRSEKKEVMLFLTLAQDNTTL